LIGAPGFPGARGSAGDDGNDGNGILNVLYDNSSGFSTINFTNGTTPFVSTSIKGATGSQGIQGSIGSQGIQGNTGNNGSQGIQGVIGLTGNNGINAKNIITTSLANDNRITFNFNDSSSITTTNALTISNDTTYTQEEIDSKDTNTSNYVLELLEIIPYEKLSVPLKDSIGIGNIVPPITSEPIIDIDDDYKYIAFTNTEANQTPYTITFNEKTICDILIVGGGGAGGSDNAGGGGGGGLVFIDNFGALGVYNIVVGKGGIGRTIERPGFSGNDSIFNNASIEFIASGGGGGDAGLTGFTNGVSGGSGGGSAGERDPDAGGVSNQILYNNGVYDRGFGNSGGRGALGGGGGGGGAFQVGVSTTNTLGAVGGNGKYEANGINFQSIFGLDGTEGYGELYDDNIYFSGGGGGGNNNAVSSTVTNGIFSNRGGFGGGGRGATNNGGGAGNNGFDALDNTGGGGGGGQYNAAPDGRGGNGGSGIVIIRYKYTKPIIIQIPNEGYLNYKLTGWEISDIVGDTNILIQDTSNYVTNTSNDISTKITNLPKPDLTPYRLVNDSYTKLEADTKDTNTSNVISTRITNLPQPDLTIFRLVNDSYTKTEVDSNILNTSNVISTRINNLPNFPSLTSYRLISDSYTKDEIDTRDTNTSNVISTRINNLLAPQNYVLPTASATVLGGIIVGDGLSILNDVLSSSSAFLIPIETSSGSGMFQQLFTNGVKLQDQFFGKLYISSDTTTNPEMLNNTMVHNLEVNGNTKIIGNIKFSGNLYKNDVLFTGGSDWIKTGNNISYNAGNVGIGNTNPLYQLSLGTHLINGGDGKLYIEKNTGNGSARFFTIKYNAGYDMCFSDSDNKDVLRVSHSAPANSLYINGSGNVGIGNGNPNQKLTVQGNIQVNGEVYATGNLYAGPSYNGGFYSGDSNWGFKISNFGSEYWTEARGYWHQAGRGFRCFNATNGAVLFVV